MYVDPKIVHILHMEKKERGFPSLLFHKYKMGRGFVKMFRLINAQYTLVLFKPFEGIGSECLLHTMK
jgi:hypothetical protein